MHDGGANVDAKAYSKQANGKYYNNFLWTTHLHMGFIASVKLLVLMNTGNVPRDK